ncbi:unnamed protein product [Sphagnum tenellum]
MLTERGVSNEWFVDSAGTSDHEEDSDMYVTAHEVLKRHQVPVREPHQARQDEEMRRRSHEASEYERSELRMLSYFNEDPANKNKRIEDPWLDDTVDGYERVYVQCKQALEGLLNSIYGTNSK